MGGLRLDGVRRLILVLVLAAIGIAAWWLRREAPEVAPTPVPDQRRPDYIADGLVVVTTDIEGRISRRLSTPQLRHYPDTDTNELEQPHLTVYRDDGPPWLAQAETGWVTGDGDEVLLRGDVRIDREGFADNPPTALRTRWLVVLPQSDYAYTHRFVELTRGHDWITAEDGLEVWFGEPLRVRLFGRTRAVHHVAQPGSAAANEESRGEAQSD